MGKIRVVVADDSSLARGLLRAMLESEGDIEVVGEAGNGRQAIEQVRSDKPDLLVIDLEMPVMGGLAAIEEIMHSKAVPILVVSSVLDAAKALDAVRLGALDVMNKPDYSPEQAAELLAKVRLLAGVSVITRMRPRNTTPPPMPASSSGMRASVGTSADPALLGAYQKVFAIAASTGGPQALALILPALPADFPCPVLVSQHIADGFVSGMADWLATLCKLPVRVATEGELMQPGVIYLSPSEQHLRVLPSRRLSLRARGANDLYRPSCDVLLQSVAEVFAAKVVGIILTGMGHDGVLGLAAIRAAGGATWSQDEASSVIYGMNRVAVEQGVVQRVLPVAEIAAAMQVQARGALFNFSRSSS